jgi:hypothetical protein
MENTGQLEPRVSVLDEEFNEAATLEVRRKPPLSKRRAAGLGWAGSGTVGPGVQGVSATGPLQAGGMPRLRL